MRDTAPQTDTTYCLRHPEIETNLRCGRCNDPICPRCLVQSPVGARCPRCARIGASPMFSVSPGNWTLAAAAGVVTAAATGALLVGVLYVFRNVNYYGFWIVMMLGQVGIGYAVGEAVRWGARYKLNPRLRIIAGVSAFISYLVSIIVLDRIGAGPGAFTNIFAWAGLAISVYVAMGRVRP